MGNTKNEQQCAIHDFVIKFGEYECQNCGQTHEEIFNPKNITANIVKDNKSCDKSQ